MRFGFFNVGGDFLIENPLLSLLWLTPQIGELIRATRAFALDCDQCAFGTPWKKPTRFLCSTQALDDLCVQCPGTHRHEKLQGKVWHETLHRWVFRTKGAQVYPWSLCSCIALNIKEVMLRSLRHLHASFALVVPAADRKRALLSSKPWAVHRQAETAQKALQAGYQLKRGATKPLLEVELEPGQAVQRVLSVIHPFTCSQRHCLRRSSVRSFKWLLLLRLWCSSGLSSCSSGTSVLWPCCPGPLS